LVIPELSFINSLLSSEVGTNDARCLMSDALTIKSEQKLGHIGKQIDDDPYAKSSVNFEDSGAGLRNSY
jgi:hypothetical protein